MKNLPYILTAPETNDMMKYEIISSHTTLEDAIDTSKQLMEDRRDEGVVFEGDTNGFVIFKPIHITTFNKVIIKQRSING